MNFCVKEWDLAYIKKNNFCFYPNEELVKFLNRYIKKKEWKNEYVNLLKKNDLNALDFGCGIGASTNLLNNFNINCIGVDISTEAIKNAKKLFPNCHFECINNEILKYSDKSFDFSISIHCLDSMDNDLTNKIFKELARVTKKYIFATFISNEELENSDFDKQIVVQTEHEKNTIQNYFTHEKILKLTEKTNFKIENIELITNKNITKNKSNGRYYVVFKRI